MAPRRDSQQSQQQAAADTQNLPTTNGTVLERSSWLRELSNSAHLFEADIAYLLHTGCGLTSAFTAVVSTEHSFLLNTGYVQSQDYGVLNPPPIKNAFRDLYQQTRAALIIAAANGLVPGATAALASMPAVAPPALPDNHKLSPDRIMLLDLKLRNVILGLITSRGRKRHYQSLSQSGCELLAKMIAEAQPSKQDHIQSPHILKLKSQLASLRRVTMSHISQVEFDEIRDSIEELNDQLDDEDRLTNHQLCDHYTGLIENLNSPPLWLALQVELRTNGHQYGDVEETINCITRVLTVFIGRDERANEAAAAARALKVEGTRFKGKDPAKGGLQAEKSVPDSPCNLCGKMHWRSQCFQNHRADKATRDLALRIAPKSPAATGIKPSKPPPTGQKPEAPKQCETPPPEDAAATSNLAVQLDSDTEEAIAAAFANAGPETIVLGKANMAARLHDPPVASPADSESEAESLSEYPHEIHHYQSIDEYLARPAPVPTRIAKAIPVASRSNPASTATTTASASNLNYSTTLPHQVYISSSPPSLSRPSSPPAAVTPRSGRSMFLIALLVGLLSATASSVLTLARLSFMY